MGDIGFYFDSYDIPKALSKEETYQLLREFKNGSRQAKEKLILHNVRLVIYEINRKFLCIPYNRDDLISMGNIGLIKAVNTYDEKKGYEFTSYAIKCIDNEILQFLRKFKKYQYDDSLERIIHLNDESEFRLDYILIDKTDFTEEFDMEDTFVIIKKLVQNLPNRDREVIMLYFGFYGNKRYNQYEIAQKLNISQSLVSRIINLTLKKMAFKLSRRGAIEIMDSKINCDIKSGNNKGCLVKKKNL